MSLQRPILASKQILVEGRSSEIFFREWIESTDLANRIEVRDFGSISDLTGYLKLFSGLKHFRETVNSIGIIRDAEDGLAKDAFESVCASLKAAGLAFPNDIGNYSEGTPKAGVFILPNCHDQGMLETLCWRALENEPHQAHHIGCVMSYLDHLREKHHVHNEHKARIWTYLAGFGKFDPLLGRSAQAKIWNWANPAFANLSRFLNSL